MTPAGTTSAPEATAPPPVAQAQTKAVYRSTDTASLLDLIVDDMEKRELIHMEVENKRFEMNGRIANVMANAGYFYAGGEDNKKAMTLDQAMAKIEIGRAWGLGPADSIRFVYIVNGKPALENELYASKMMSAGWSWDIEWIGEQGPACKGCRLWVKFKGEAYTDRDGKPVFVEFTEAMAKNAGLLGKSGPWTNYKWSMYFWRCISNVRRFYCPNILTGAVTRDEALDFDDLEVGQPASNKRKLAVQLDELQKAAQATPEPDKAQSNKATESPRPATISNMFSVAKEIGEVEFFRILSECGFDKPADIPTQEIAETVLGLLKKAVQ